MVSQQEQYEHDQCAEDSAQLKYNHYASYVFLGHKKTLIRIDSVDVDSGDIKVSILCGTASSNEVSVYIKNILDSGELFIPFVVTEEDRCKIKEHKKNRNKKKKGNLGVSRKYDDEVFDIEKIRSRGRRRFSYFD